MKRTITSLSLALAVAFGTTAALAQTPQTAPMTAGSPSTRDIDQSAGIPVMPSRSEMQESRTEERRERQESRANERRERADYGTRSRAEEEHGGVRNWFKDKLGRRAGSMTYSGVGTPIGNGRLVDDGGGLVANGHVTS